MNIKENIVCRFVSRTIKIYSNNLLRKCLFYFRFFRLIKIGITVVITFILCWLPFLSSVDSALQVLNRLFPFSRGLYEVGY